MGPDPISAEDWRWGSAWLRVNGNSEQKKIITDTRVDFPKDYCRWVNVVDEDSTITALRNSVNKSTPYGRNSWVTQMIGEHGLESTVRPGGRPLKQQ